MKKLDFKKLAVLGVVSGAALTGQVEAGSPGVSGTYLAAACGGSPSQQGCGAGTTSTVTGPGPAEYYNQANKNGCSASGPARGQTQQQTPQQMQQQQMQQQQMQPQYQASCGGAAQGRGYNPNNRGNVADSGYMPQRNPQPQMGCGGYNQPQQQYQNQYYQNQGQNQGQNNYQNQNPQSSYWNQQQGGYVAEATVPPQKNGMMMTEKDLMMHLNDQGKATYQTLDAAGKARALKLAGEMSDKNQAVKMAASEMSAKRANGNAPAPKY